jgi:hypothetical protein
VRVGFVGGEHREGHLWVSLLIDGGEKKEPKDTDKSWQGKFIHSHPIGLGQVKEQQAKYSVSLPYTTIETTFYLG